MNIIAPLWKPFVVKLLFLNLVLVAFSGVFVAFGVFGGGSSSRRDGEKNSSKVSNSDSARRAVNFAPKISSGGRF